MKENLNLVFMGTPEIGAIILRALIDSGYKIDTVITRIDKPRGRSRKPEKSPVKILAEEYSIPVFQPTSKIELEEFVVEKKPDLIVVCAFGMIVTKLTLEAAKMGAINVHPSLLPHYRGPAPISSPILGGDKKTGTTIMLMNEGMDEGEILAQKDYLLTGQEDTSELTEKLAHLSAELILETIPKYLLGEIIPKPQNHQKATYTKMIKKEEGHISFKNQTAQEIERMSRAYSPWPGIYTFWNNKKIDLIRVNASNKKIPPGVLVFEKEKFYVGTKSGSLEILSLKIEGKKEAYSSDFIRGYSEILESDFY